MKRFIGLIMAVALVLVAPVSAFAEDVIPIAEADLSVAAADDDAISVLIDGKYVEFDVHPTLINDRTMVPVRAIFEALGATVDWIDETWTVVSEMGDTKVSLKINERYLNKNDEIIVLDVPAQLVGERTLVPVRAISEAYGCSVAWNEYTNTVVITSDLNKSSMMTVNDEAVSVGYFNHVLAQVENYVMQSFNTGAEYLKKSWASALGDTTFGQYIIESAVEQCVFTKSNVQAAKALGIELDEKDMAAINENIAFFEMNYGEYYDEYLASVYTTKEAMEEFITDSIYSEKYYNYLIEQGEMSEADIKKYLDDNYIRAKHILFSTFDAATGMPLSEEDAAAKKKLAEETLAKLKKNADFDKTMAELSEDPGSESYPDGYLFTKGEMVEAFEKAAFALKEGSLSGIVESDYGYHIIKRVKNGEYTEQDIYMVKEYLVSDKVSAAMNANKANAKITSDANMLANAVPVGLE